MVEKIDFEIVSPEKLLFSEPVEMVVVPGIEGDLGVLPAHSPLIAIVRPGVIEVYQEGSVKHKIFVAGGFCEIDPKRCTVMASEAMHIGDIDKSEALRRETEANKLEPASDVDLFKVEKERRIAHALVVAVSN